MIVNLGDWVLQIDTAATCSYSGRILQDHCSCGYCRNFASSLADQHPELVYFLEQFGRNFAVPDELMPFEPTLYQATYCICGTILQKGTIPLEIDGIQIVVLDSHELDFETECSAPCFALMTSIFELPWVLDENMDEVVSPANEPEYLQLMWKKYLEQVSPENEYS